MLHRLQDKKFTTTTTINKHKKVDGEYMRRENTIESRDG